MSDNQTSNIFRDRELKYARRYPTILQIVKRLTKELGQAPETKQVEREAAKIDDEVEWKYDGLYKKHLCSAGFMDETVAKVWKLTKEGEELSVEDLDETKCFEINKLWDAMRISTSGIYTPIVKFLRIAGTKGVHQDEMIKHICIELKLNDDDFFFGNRLNSISSEFEGDSKFRNLVITACKKLHKEKFVEKKENVWGITEKGENVDVDTLAMLLTSKSKKDLDPKSKIEKATEEEILGNKNEPEEQVSNPISIEEVMKGCFLEREKVDAMVRHWKNEKNLILQGPPGTGKTWLAKRLAKLLVNSADPNRIRVVQFHPSTSYEDFVLGYRPAGKRGKLRVKPGVFLQMAKNAKENKGKDFVLVIEEINRGRPAQIFGELLTLIENTKRNKESAMQLIYHKDGKNFYVPDNLYIIGTMNLADRSLAMVDIALRRRFAFYDLKPQFGKEWKKWCREKKLEEKIIDRIGKRMNDLNEEIIKPRLGEQFYVGHSYVTPEKDVGDAEKWFAARVESNLVPLLAEYFISEPQAFEDAKKKLKEPLEMAGGGEDDSSEDEGELPA